MDCGNGGEQGGDDYNLAAKGMVAKVIEESMNHIDTCQSDLNVTVRSLEKTEPLKEIVTAPEKL